MNMQRILLVSQRFFVSAHTQWRRHPARLDYLYQCDRRSASTTSTESLPPTQPSIWTSLIPKFLRTSDASTKAAQRHKQREWSPYTFFIVIFLFIGSNAMNLIALRKEFTAFSRQSDAKIALLKEALERVQRGEDVDVARLLGTGDEEKEREWEQVLREIENESQTETETNGRRRRKMKEAEEGGSTLSAKVSMEPETGNASQSINTNKSSSPRPPGFY